MRQISQLSQQTFNLRITMNKNIIVCMLLMISNFQPIAASNENDPIAEQVRLEIQNSICCRIAMCQLRSHAEQYDNDDSSPYDNCDTPLNALQTTLRCIFCPLMVAEILIMPCWKPCEDCYKSHRINQIKRENLIREINIMLREHNHIVPINLDNEQRVLTIRDYINNSLPRATATIINATDISIITAQVQDEL